MSKEDLGAAEDAAAFCEARAVDDSAVNGILLEDPALTRLSAVLPARAS